MGDEAAFCMRCACSLNASIVAAAGSKLHFPIPIVTSRIASYRLILGFSPHWMCSIALIFGILGLRDSKKKKSHGALRAYFALSSGLIFSILYTIIIFNIENWRAFFLLNRLAKGT